MIGISGIRCSHRHADRRGLARFGRKKENATDFHPWRFRFCILPVRQAEAVARSCPAFHLPVRRRCRR
ncbi:hypothetical protein, partial [Burkholderia cepacia]